MSELPSPAFLTACAKLRVNDLSVLPERNGYFSIKDISTETERVEIAKALIQSTGVTEIRLCLDDYSEEAAQAMGEYLRSSKHLRTVCLRGSDSSSKSKAQRTLSIFLRGLEDSMSVTDIDLSCCQLEKAASRALTSLLIHSKHSKSLKTLSMDCNEDMDPVLSCLAKHKTLQDLTLTNQSTTSLTSSIHPCVGYNPALKTLCLNFAMEDMSGLDTLLQNDNSKITELIIDMSEVEELEGDPGGFDSVLQTLGRKAALTKLELHGILLNRDHTRQLQTLLRKCKSLHTFALSGCPVELDSSEEIAIERANLAGIATVLQQHKSIKELDLSNRHFMGAASDVTLLNIIRRNKTITKLDLSGGDFGERFESSRWCFAVNLSSSIRDILLSRCSLGNRGVSILAESLFSRNGILQKLDLSSNDIDSAGLRSLVEGMIEHESQLTDLDLSNNSIGDKGASYLADTLGDNALPHLTRLCLSACDFGDDGLVHLVLALETNQALKRLDLSENTFSERGFSSLAMSLPTITNLERIHFQYFAGLASAMPPLLEGLRKNTSVVLFNITRCSIDSFPPTDEETARFAGGWMQEIKYLGYRNHFLPLVQENADPAPPLGIWSHALSKVATFPDVLFRVLRSSKAAWVTSAKADGNDDSKPSANTDDNDESKKRKR